MKYFKHVLSAFMLFAVCVGFVNSAETASKAAKVEQSIGEWKKVKDTDGIVVYVQRNEISSRFKAVGRLEVNDLYSPAAVLEDYDAMPEWLVFLTKVKELKRTDAMTRYIYGEMKNPIIDNRDAVFKVDISQDPKTKSVTLAINNEPDFIPENPDFIRIAALEGLIQYDVMTKNEVMVTIEIDVDLKGELPDSVSDYMLMYGPYLAFLELKEALKKPKYHNREKDIPYLKF